MMSFAPNWRPRENLTIEPKVPGKEKGKKEKGDKRENEEKLTKRMPPRVRQPAEKP